MLRQRNFPVAPLLRLRRARSGWYWHYGHRKDGDREGPWPSLYFEILYFPVKLLVEKSSSLQSKYRRPANFLWPTRHSTKTRKQSSAVNAVRFVRKGKKQSAPISVFALLRSRSFMHSTPPVSAQMCRAVLPLKVCLFKPVPRFCARKSTMGRTE